MIYLYLSAKFYACALLMINASHTLFTMGQFIKLSRFATRSAFHAHLAYLAAGFVVLLMPRRSGEFRQNTSWATLVLAAVLMVSVLSMGAMALGAAQPLLYQAGSLSFSAWVMMALGLFIAHRYFVGRKALRKFCDTRAAQIAMRPATLSEVHA